MTRRLPLAVWSQGQFSGVLSLLVSEECAAEVLLLWCEAPTVHDVVTCCPGDASQRLGRHVATEDEQQADTFLLPLCPPWCRPQMSTFEAKVAIKFSEKFT